MAEKDNRPSGQIYAYIRALGAQMMLTNQMSREGVTAMCAGLVRLYQNLAGGSD